MTKILIRKPRSFGKSTDLGILRQLQGDVPVINIGKLREANRSLKCPIVTKYLQKIRDGEDAGLMVDKMLSTMSADDLHALVKELLSG